MNELERFDATRGESRAIFIRKNEAYGTAYSRRGALGVLIRMEDKIARAINLILEGAEEGDERLEDTLLDLDNYSTIAAMLAARRNLKGER